MSNSNINIKKYNSGKYSEYFNFPCQYVKNDTAKVDIYMLQSDGNTYINIFDVRLTFEKSNAIIYLNKSFLDGHESIFTAIFEKNSCSMISSDSSSSSFYYDIKMIEKDDMYAKVFWHFLLYLKYKNCYFLIEEKETIFDIINNLRSQKIMYDMHVQMCNLNEDVIDSERKKIESSEPNKADFKYYFFKSMELIINNLQFAYSSENYCVHGRIMIKKCNEIELTKNSFTLKNNNSEKAIKNKSWFSLL